MVLNSGYLISTNRKNYDTISTSTHSFGAAFSKRTVLNALLKLMYEVCPKSNETGVIKTLSKNIEIYQSQIPSK